MKTKPINALVAYHMMEKAKELLHEPDNELHRACEIVERHARAIGKDCQVIFTTSGVEIAPLSWAGSETASNLFEAIQQAAKSAQL